MGAQLLTDSPVYEVEELRGGCVFHVLGKNGSSRLILSFTPSVKHL